MTPTIEKNQKHCDCAECDRIHLFTFVTCKPEIDHRTISTQSFILSYNKFNAAVFIQRLEQYEINIINRIVFNGNKIRRQNSVKTRKIVVQCLSFIGFRYLIL